MVIVTAEGAVMVTGVAADAHRLASLTTIWYVFAPNPLNTLLAWYVTPLSFEYSNVPVPPVAVTVIVPSVAVAQLRSAPLNSVLAALVIVTAEGAVMVTGVAADAHRLASLTTIWYVFAPNPLNTLLAWYVIQLSFE